jgi:hypothetical protein
LNEEHRVGDRVTGRRTGMKLMDADPMLTKHKSLAYTVKHDLPPTASDYLTVEPDEDSCIAKFMHR